jgi:hypothetical protein
MSIRSFGLGRLSRALRAAFAATVLLLATASVAAADCPTQPTSQAFAKFGDTAQYSEIPNGSFESGAGWTFISSKLAAGNDGYNVIPGQRSASLGGGFVSAAATLISPAFCVDKTHPYFRFMLRPMGAVGALATFILFRNSSGNLVRQLVGSNVSTTFSPGYWRPSVLNPLSINIPLLEAGDTATVQLMFVTPLSLNGPAYYIDNVLVDPYRRG